MDEALRAERMVVIRAGRLVRDGSPSEIFRDPALSRWGLAAPPVVELASRLAARLPGLSRELRTADALAHAAAEALR
jgi:hypothetical protein